MKLPLTIQIPKEVRMALDENAEAAFTDTTKYAAQMLGIISKLKPEHALTWMASIPTDLYRRRPSRPTELRNDIMQLNAAEGIPAQQ